MIMKGDCIEVMKAIKPNSVDAVVTDPPYGLEFMGKEWDKLWAKRDGRKIELPPDEYGKKHGTHPFLQAKVDKYQGGLQAQLWHTQWLTEAYRVLKPGGSMLVMGGTRTFHRLACAIEDSGFVIKDTLAFMYGSGFPKAQDLTNMLKKRGVNTDEYLGLKVGGIKPAYEPIIWAVKPPEGSYVDNVLKWGVGAVNVDECRISHDEFIRIKKKQYDGSLKNPKCVQAGRYKDTTELKPSGRFPSNVILSHHPECVQVGVKKVKSKSGGIGNSTTKSMFSDGRHLNCGNWYADPDGLEQVESWDCHPDCAVRLLDEQSGVLKSHGGGTTRTRGIPFSPVNKQRRNPEIVPKGDSGGASRFFYCAKASRGERNAGLNELPEKDACHYNQSGRRYGGGNRENWKDPYKKPQFQNNHPTVKPIKLFEYLIKLVTRESQIILDPFIGSGTTAIAAHNVGRKCVGIEKEDEYLTIAKRRIDHWRNQPKQMEIRA